MKSKKSFQIRYSKKVKKDLQSLDIQTSKRIKSKINFFSHQSNPFFFAEKLIGFHNRYRWRIGRYRVLFDKNKKTKEITILIIITVKKRSEAYKNL